MEFNKIVGKQKNNEERVNIVNKDGKDMVSINLSFEYKSKLDSLNKNIKYTARDKLFYCEDVDSLDEIRNFVNNIIKNSDIKNNNNVNKIPRIEPPNDNNENRHLPNNSFFNKNYNLNKKDQVTVNQIDSGDVLIKGPLYDYKEQLKQLVPYDSRQWNNELKAWVCRADYYELILDFVEKINNNLLPKDIDIVYTDSNNQSNYNNSQNQNKFTNNIININRSPIYTDNNNNKLVQTINNKELINSNGLNYQVLVIVAVLPTVGQHLELIYNENNDKYMIKYTITKIISNMQFLAKPETNSNDNDVDEEYFVISCGNWCNEYHTNSQINFLPN